MAGFKTMDVDFGGNPINEGPHIPTTGNTEGFKELDNTLDVKKGFEFEIKGSAHPGFENAAEQISSKQNIPIENAKAILADRSRKASPTARARNANLSKVRGSAKGFEELEEKGAVGTFLAGAGLGGLAGYMLAKPDKSGSEVTPGKRNPNLGSSAPIKVQAPKVVGKVPTVKTSDKKYKGFEVEEKGVKLEGAKKALSKVGLNLDDLIKDITTVKPEFTRGTQSAEGLKKLNKKVDELTGNKLQKGFEVEEKGVIKNSIRRFLGIPEKLSKAQLIKEVGPGKSLAAQRGANALDVKLMAEPKKTEIYNKPTKKKKPQTAQDVRDSGMWDLSEDKGIKNVEEKGVINKIKNIFGGETKKILAQAEKTKLLKDATEINMAKRVGNILDNKKNAMSELDKNMNELRKGTNKGFSLEEKAINPKKAAKAAERLWDIKRGAAFRADKYMNAYDKVNELSSSPLKKYAESQTYGRGAQMGAKEVRYNNLADKMKKQAEAGGVKVRPDVGEANELTIPPSSVHAPQDRQKYFYRKGFDLEEKCSTPRNKFRTGPEIKCSFTKNIKQKGVLGRIAAIVYEKATEEEKKAKKK